MRQVSKSPSFLIIGHGRVARHFAHYLTLLNITYEQWHRGLNQASLNVFAQTATHIFLLINDDAIESFVADHLQNTGAIKIHFSGSLTTSSAFGAHPLMTFGTTLYDLATYQAIPFVVEDNAPENDLLLPLLPNRMERISADKKALYHALCVMAGNFSCLLWQKLFDRFDRDLGLPPEIAHSYLKQQTENLLQDYKSALTGPLARGDEKTIARNVDALEGDAFQDVYKSFVTAYQKEKKS